MSLPGNFLKWLWLTERRRASRKSARALSAYYWNGAEPSPRRVKNLSAEGMYLVTEERWYPNTLLSVALTRTNSAPEDVLHSVKVVARVVWSEPGGVGFAFVFPPAGCQGDQFSENAASRRLMDQFMDVLERGALPLKNIPVSVDRLRNAWMCEVIAGS